MASQRAASLVLLVGAVGVAAQEMPGCYSAGSVVGAVLGTLVVTLALVALAYALYRMYWRNRRGKHLVLVTDPERADLGDQYAFDNPCFRDGTPIGKGGYEKEPVKADNRNRWTAWSPLGALVGNRNEKRRALDDSFTGEPQVNVVSLRSHDFTGLGFSVCGNMRDGIFVKDVLHRGPASESGRITPGDRIDSIRISFRHMVFEDALTILSYASPYEVQLEVENPSPSSRPSTLLRTKRESIEPADRICHPFYRSQSIADLAQIGTASLKRVQDIGGLKSPRRVKSEAWDESKAGEYPTLKLSPSPTKETVNLEKTASPSNPTSVVMVKPERSKKPVPKPESPSTQNDGNVNKDVKTEVVGKHQKFGVRVLPDPKALAARLKNTSGEVKLGPDMSKKPTMGEKPVQNTVKIVENKNVKQPNVTETEHQENEQNSKVEQINIVTVPSKIVDAGTHVFTSQSGGHMDVVDTSKGQGRLVPKSLFYDERGIDVGPVEEEENRRKSASYEPRSKDEELTKKPNTEATGNADGHSNVKLLLTKGLQNLKEKLHHHDRKKNNTTPEPQPDVEVNPNPSPSKKKSGKGEKPRKNSSSDSDAAPEKNEVKMRITGQTKVVNRDKEQKKEMKVDEERHPNEGQIPTELPEEVRRAAVAARSNRKSCSNLPTIDANVISIVQGNGEPAAETETPPELSGMQISSTSVVDVPVIKIPMVKQRVHHQESWSEDSSGDGDDLGAGTSGSNDTDSVDRAPKRSNKRKAPLPPPEDLEDMKMGQSAKNKGTGKDTTRVSRSWEINGTTDDLHRRIMSGEMDDSYTKLTSADPKIVNHEIKVMGVHGGSESRPIFTDMAKQKNNPPPHNEVTNIMVESDSSSEPKNIMAESNSSSDPKIIQGTKNDSDNIVVDVTAPSKKTDDANSESDSDMERQEIDSSPQRNKKGGTTIELNSSHITIHHSPSADTVTLELEGDSTRKAASLGDLSRFDTDQPMSVLERAVSLDLADSGTPHSCKKRKAPLPPPEEDYLNTMQDGEDETLYRKEPRLDNALDTFQRRRLKKSSDWGTMEDAVQQASPPNSRKSVNLVSDVNVTHVDGDSLPGVELGESGNEMNKAESREVVSTPEETAVKGSVVVDTFSIVTFPKASARSIESTGQTHVFTGAQDAPSGHIQMQVLGDHGTNVKGDNVVEGEIVINNGPESLGQQKTVLRITPEPSNNIETVTSSRVTFAPTSSTSGPSSLSADEVMRSLTPDQDHEIAGSRLMTLIQGAYRNEARSVEEDPNTSSDSTPSRSQFTERHTIVSSTPLPNREQHTQYVETIQSPQVTSSDGGVQNIQVVSSSRHNTSTPFSLMNVSRSSGFDSTLSSKSDDSYNGAEQSISVTSATDPYVTAGSVVDSTTTYISNSDDDDSTLGHDLPPELPTSPVPVLASAYTPSSSMTYITEIQVSTITPNKAVGSRRIIHNGTLETEMSSNSKPTRKRDSSISSDSIGSGGDDKDLDTSISSEIKPQEDSNEQQHNNVTVTAIRNNSVGNVDKSKIPTRIGADSILTTFQSSPIVGSFDRPQIPMRSGTDGVMTTFQSNTNVKNIDQSQIPIRVGSEGVLTTFKSNVSVGSGDKSQIPTRIVTSSIHEGTPTTNNGISFVEKKSKPVRPPVPPRKSDTAVSSVVTVEIPSPNRSLESVHNKFVSGSNAYGIFESSPNVQNSGSSKKFISFSSLTPRSVSGDASGRNNSSFEQWVFLEGDQGHASNGSSQHNGQDATGEDNSHSTVVTLPATLGSRPPSVTHILLDAKQSSGSRNSQ